MLGDGILWDGTEREAEQAAKALDQWNSLAEDHQRVMAERDDLLAAIFRWMQAPSGMEANWAARDLEAVARKIKGEPSRDTLKEDSER